MCFFFILGVVPRERKIGTETRLCSYEGHGTVHEVIERRMWFTLFFIPLFPVSGRQIVARCTSCGVADSGRGGYEHIPHYPSAPEPRTCPNCGGRVSDEARFCEHCGWRLL